MATPAMHWAGGCNAPDGRGGVVCWAPGWPCCCYGDKATRIRRAGQQTHDRASVTCPACLRTLARAEGPRRPLPVAREPFSATSGAALSLAADALEHEARVLELAGRWSQAAGHRRQAAAVRQLRAAGAAVEPPPAIVAAPSPARPDAAEATPVVTRS